MKKPTRYERERRSLKNRPRKVLNLEERVLAIRLYQRNPVYQRVASVFKCSWEQIRNIVANRDEIIDYYGRCQTIEPDDPSQYVRNKKINFLGHVAYEFIRRAHYHRSAQLNDETLRTRAFEIRDALKIDQFYPNKAWIIDFKKIYNIDWAQMNSLVIGETPPQSLNTKDIVEYCKQMVDRMLAMRGQVMERSSKRTDLDDFDEITYAHTAAETEAETFMETNDIDEQQSDHSAGSATDFFTDANVRVVHENDDFSGTYTSDARNENYNDDFDDFAGFNASEALDAADKEYENYNNEDGAERVTVALSPTQLLTEVQIKQERCSPSPSRITPQPIPSLTIASVSSTNVDALMESLAMPAPSSASCSSGINSYTEALQHLRPLEDFAAHAEDFRALNLLTLLVQVYEKGVKEEKQKQQQQHRLYNQ